MLWVFDRDDESVRLETQYDNLTSQFVVTVHYSDGQQHQQRFADKSALFEWLEMFEFHLALQHWTGRTGSIILPYGWRDRPARDWNRFLARVAGRRG